MSARAHADIPDTGYGLPYPALDLDTEIRREAQRCVACGLCVPLCPTYRKTLNEADSPRGRVALALALAQGELPWSERLQSHLDLCLDCRACERACPSEVAYGRLYDLTRARLGPLRPGSRRLRRLMLDAITSPRWLARLGRLVRAYQRSGIPRLVRRSRLLRLFGLEAAERILPLLPAPEPLAVFYPAAGRRRGAVALFTGCVARLTDTQTLAASMRLLTRLGYDVHVPAQQVCCGALHQHDGEHAGARERMRVNLRAFGDLPVEAIVVTASGCGAWLRESPQWLDNAREAEDFAAKITDVSAFLARAGVLDDQRLAPLPGRRIAVHDPCTLANGLREAEPVYRILRRIPGAEVIPLPENTLCCGGAGLYPLLQPKMAVRLRADKLAHAARLAPDILATSNVGCAMHLAAGIREAGLNIEVAHPVVLIERQLRAARGE